jgi:O-glycosyl hydrolase
MKNNILGKALIGIVFMFISINLGAQTATIDASTEYQTIRGFGGHNMPDWIGDLTSNQVDKAFGNEPGQIGLNILRMKVPMDTINFQYLIPSAVRAASYGAILMASPWSPPPTFKTNQSHIGGSLSASHYDDYANYLRSYVNYLESHGAPLYALSIQNEPDISVQYESCDWTSTEMLNFVKYNMVDISPVKLMVAESYNFDHTMTDPILNDSVAASKIGIIGGHIYGNGLYDYPLARVKEKEIWMTEHLEDNSTWAGALTTAKEINDCMKANFNAYIWFYVRATYGPLDLAGNITKRGYVMSQYTKFVRPGYIRVDATTNGVSNIDITSFKNDTNLVIVVVNRNTSSQSIDITISNDTVNVFTKFTTSATKNLYNEGTINVVGNTFTANLDGQSVTTFTSIDTAGGRFGNSAPIANAGADQEITDADTSGYETVILDGSGSIDSDGTISNFTWSRNGLELAFGINPTIELATGVHKIALTVTDNDGGISTDSVIIEVKLAAGLVEENIWLEAECAYVGSNWDFVANAEASNGYYATISSGMNSVNAASEDSSDQIIFNLNITQTGNYTLWGRVRVPSANDDSFWVKMDDGDWTMWNSITGSSALSWDEVHNSNNNSLVMNYTLDPGPHTIKISYREDGAGLDKIYLANTGNIPSGLGGTADSCSIGGPDGLMDINQNNGFQMTIYPNPITSLATIEYTLPKAENITLSIIDITGRPVETLYDGFCNVGFNKVVFENSNYENGIYFCVIRTTNGSQFEKMIINK